MGWHTRQQERDFNSYFSMPFEKMGGLNIHYNNDIRKVYNPLYLMVGVQCNKKSTKIIEYHRTIAHIYCIIKPLRRISVVFMEAKIIKCNIFYTKWFIHYEKISMNFSFTFVLFLPLINIQFWNSFLIF